MFQRVAEMIGKQLKLDPAQITMESRLVEDLKADSANVMMLVMDLEQDLGIMMEDDVLIGLKTVGDVVRYIEANT